VNELVMNSVRHAGTPCRLDIRLDRRGLRVAARDDGPVTSALLGSVDHPPPCGTGLHLVAALSRRWGVEQHVDGKTVWARLTPRRDLSAACPAE
jgi:anti-sigma regulatory factor (Ser/Thr protein kinase)